MDEALKERKATGRLLRKVVPRSAHADLGSPAGVRDPLGVLKAQATSRVPELVPIRHGRMAESAFAFFRGGAAIMAMDLATTATTGLIVQACGDAHVSNFGKFATPERNLVFDINDFDETLPGPWEWDVKRLCASLHIVPEERGFSPRAPSRWCTTAARAYRERHGELRDHAHARALVRPDRDRDVFSTSRLATRPRLRRDVETGAAQGPRAGRRSAHPTRRRPSALRRGSAVDRAPQRHELRHGRRRRR